jgi:hypothetical protein
MWLGPRACDANSGIESSCLRAGCISRGAYPTLGAMVVILRACRGNLRAPRYWPRSGRTRFDNSCVDFGHRTVDGGRFQRRVRFRSAVSCDWRQSRGNAVDWAARDGSCVSLCRGPLLGAILPLRLRTKLFEPARARRDDSDSRSSEH